MAINVNNLLASFGTKKDDPVVNGYQSLYNVCKAFIEEVCIDFLNCNPVKAAFSLPPTRVASGRIAQRGGLNSALLITYKSEFSVASQNIISSMIKTDLSDKNNVRSFIPKIVLMLQQSNLYIEYMKIYDIGTLKSKIKETL